MPKSKKNQMLDKLKVLRRKRRLQRDEFVINPDGTTTKVPKKDNEVKET